MAETFAGRASWNHLTDLLHDDARPHWDRRRGAAGPGNGSHEMLHRLLSGVKRDLRRDRGQCGVHAGAVLTTRGALLLVGPTGSGKSTLTMDLGVHLGAAIISDDLVWLDGLLVRGFGSPVALRRTNCHFEAARDLWYATDEDRLLVRPDDLGIPVENEARNVAVVVLPRFDTSLPADAGRLSGAEAFLELIRSSLGKLEPTAVDQMAMLAGTVPTVRVVYPDAATAVEMCDRVLDDAPAFEKVVPRHLTTEDTDRLGLPRHMRGIVFEDSAVLWSTMRQAVVHVEGWDGGPHLGPEARRTLESVGLTAS